MPDPTALSATECDEIAAAIAKVREHANDTGQCVGSSRGLHATADALALLLRRAEGQAASPSGALWQVDAPPALVPEGDYAGLPVENVDRALGSPELSRHERPQPPAHAAQGDEPRVLVGDVWEHITTGERWRILLADEPIVGQCVSAGDRGLAESKAGERSALGLGIAREAWRLISRAPAEPQPVQDRTHAAPGYYCTPCGGPCPNDVPRSPSGAMLGDECVPPQDAIAATWAHHDASQAPAAEGVPAEGARGEVLSDEEIEALHVRTQVTADRWDRILATLREVPKLRAALATARDDANRVGRMLGAETDRAENYRGALYAIAKAAGVEAPVESDASPLLVSRVTAALATAREELAALSDLRIASGGLNRGQSMLEWLGTLMDRDRLTRENAALRERERVLIDTVHTADTELGRMVDPYKMIDNARSILAPVRLWSYPAAALLPGKAAPEGKS